MQHALDWMRGTYGSIEQYTVAHGLTRFEIDTLRTELVAPRV